MKAIDRIYQYIDFKQIKIVDFERKNKISNGYLSKMKMRTASIGEDILNNILENCPEISPEWLLTGKGNMIKSEDNIKIVDQNSMDFFWDRYDKIVAERDRLRDQVSELQREKRSNTHKTIYADDKEKLTAAEPEKVKK